MRYAAIYQTKDKLIFCSNAQTTDGLSLSTAPYIHLNKDADAEEIRTALRDVLEANETGVPHPAQKEWGDISKKHLAGLGMKSLSALHSKALYCSVEEKDGELKLSPTKNSGHKGGYEFLPLTYLSVSVQASAEQIAETLREAMRLSAQLTA